MKKDYIYIIFFSLVDVDKSWCSIADLSERLKELKDENSKHSKVRTKHNCFSLTLFKIKE